MIYTSYWVTNSVKYTPITSPSYTSWSSLVELLLQRPPLLGLRDLGQAGPLKRSIVASRALLPSASLASVVSCSAIPIRR